MKSTSMLRTIWAAALLSFCVLSHNLAYAGFTPVAVTGYTADVVANGVGSATASISADVDGAGYAFMAADFNPLGALPTSYMPPSGMVYSVATSGVTFQLAPYSGNNSLRLTATNSGTLTFNTAQSASELYLLGVTGSGAGSANITITFTDATTQVFSAVAIPDWYGGANFAIRGLGRVNTGSNGIDNNPSDPRLYEIKLSLSAANFGKQIATVTVAKATTTGVINIMGVAINSGGPCSAPASQATALLITPGATSAVVSFAAAIPSADKYLVIRTPLGAALTTPPVNTTSYALSAALGNGTVVSVGTATSFTDAGLTANTLYRYTVFAYNDLCNGGPSYNTTNPISAAASTITVTYTNVPATGYTADVVADTAGAASGSVTADVDGVSFAFMAQNFNPSGSTFPTSYLPGTGLINSATTPGLSFQLQPYTGNNSLRLAATNSGTLTITTPLAASDLYLLATTGSGAGSANVTVTFTDASTQAFTGISIPDWYGGANYAILGVGRVTITTNLIDNNTANPRLYEIRLPISSANYGKQIASVTVNKATTTGVINVMGLAAISLPACSAPAGQPIGLAFVPGVTTTNVAFTAASPAVNKYMIVRTAAGAALTAAPVNGVTYTLNGSLGNGTIVSLSSSNSFADASLTAATQYRYTIFPYNDACSGGPMYNTSGPLTGVVTTNSVTTYTWTGATNFSWTVPTNWSPTRYAPDPTDVILFTNGQTNAVYGVPTQTIRRLVVNNNTTAMLQASSAVTLTLASDNVAGTAELDIASGSTLLSNGHPTTASSLTLAFSGTGATANIAGTLEAYSLATVAGNNVFNFTNAVATVTNTGILTIGGTNTGASVTGNTAANLIVNGTLNYKYTSTNTPVIPVANWSTGSTALISGFNSATAAPGGLNQTFFNLTYNCPSQTTATNWAGGGPLNVSGTLTVAATGTGSLVFSATQGYNYQVGNFSQTGGTLNLNSGVAATTPTLNVSGNFNQSGGTFTSTGASTGANAPVLHFNGVAGTQSVSFFNAAPAGPITYRISNPAGINLSGSGTLTSSFNLNTNGGVRISSTASNPISTSLALNYSTTGTTLTYDAPAAQTMTANVFPTANGPVNLTINTGGSGNIATMPFSRTVPGVLTMTSGDIDMGTNTLTLGSSAAAPGTLTYTSGNIRVGTGGSFTRWYGTSGLPVAAGNGIGFYPIGYNGLSRAVSLFFNSSTALSTGGTIGVSHTNVAGFTNGLSVADGAYTIDTRINSSWAFSTSAVTLSGTIGLQLTGAGLYTSPNPANVRAMKASSIAGTHIPGFASSAARSGLALTDLAVPYYIGAAAADIVGVYTAITTGNWGAGSTWDIGTAPGVADEAYINPGVTVTSNASTNTARSLTILPGGILNIASGNTVTVDSALQNNGTVNVTGGTLLVNGRTSVSGIINNGSSLISLSAGTVNLGPSGGGARPFAQNGILTVSGGALTINGNMSTVAGSIINQSAGNINIDGNAGGVAANSVACGIPILSLTNAANNLTGGTFTVVDAHACTTGTNTMVYNNAANISATGTHIFRMGDGVSTDPGGQTPFNFSVNTSLTSTGKFAFNDLVINTGTPTNSAFVQGSATMGITRNLTVNAGGEFRNNASTQTTYINGNLTTLTGGIFTGLGTVAFANFASGTAVAATGAQLVSGGGTFRNAVSATPTANFNSFLINNSFSGVTLNIGGVSYSGALTFTLGKLYTGTGVMIQNAGATITGTSQTTGWIVGKFQKNAVAGGLLHTYPIGDNLYYTPVTIAGTAAAGGDIAVGTMAGDHPAILSSLINSTRSVNRNWSIQQVNGLTFSSAGATVTPTWNPAEVDAGASFTNFTAAQFDGSSSVWIPASTTSPLATSIAISVANTVIDGEYQVGETCSSISIGTQPSGQLVCNGSPASFSVGVPGTAGVLYQWQKNGVNISGATGNTFTIPSATVADVGNYRVVVSSQCGPIAPVTSAVAALTVNTPPSIGTNPSSQLICERRPVTFTVAATGTGLSYQWEKNGLPIAGATGSSYTISSVSLTDAGNYGVMVIGATPCGTVGSSVAVLNVSPLPQTITAATTTTFCAGGSVVLNAPTGYSYQWLLNNSNIPSATGAAYTATVSGNFRAIITNSTAGCSDTSISIAVVANGAPPSSITPAGTAVFCVGGSTVLSGPPTGGITYQWNLNGTPIPLATGVNYTANAAGNYTLTVAAGSGCTNTSPVTVVSANPLPPATITAAGSTAICTGSGVTLNANTGPTFAYVWSLNGNPILPSATASSYFATGVGTFSVQVTNTATGCQNTSAGTPITVNPLPTSTVSATGSTTFCQGDSVMLSGNTGTGLTYAWHLNGTPVTPAATGITYAAKAAGSYTLLVTNTATGCVKTSVPTIVTVNALPNVAVSASGSLAICAGSVVTLSVPQVGGLTYQWKLNGSAISTGTSDTLKASAAGTYTVTVTNTGLGCVATSANTVVTVNPAPPASTTPTGSSSACQGDTVYLKANSGTGLSYQWNVNGSPITGATGISYGATGTGAYTVTVKNSSNCAVTSTAVNINIKPSPTSVISYSTSLAFCAGGRVVLNAITNASGASYQWRTNGAPIVGATSNFLFATTAGSYSVTVTSSNGCAATSTTANVVVNPLPNPVITRTDSTLSTGNYLTYQWYYNGNAVSPGGTSQSYTFKKNGSYSVIVTDVNGCTNQSLLFFVNGVGVANTGMSQNIRVYPNPSRRVVFIDAPMAVNVVVRDLTGRIVLRVYGAKQIDMQDLADGAYMMTISDDEGRVIRTEKLMKTAD